MPPVMIFLLKGTELAPSYSLKVMKRIKKLTIKMLYWLSIAYFVAPIPRIQWPCGNSIITHSHKVSVIKRCQIWLICMMISNTRPSISRNGTRIRQKNNVKTHTNIICNKLIYSYWLTSIKISKKCTTLIKIYLFTQF